MDRRRDPPERRAQGRGSGHLGSESQRAIERGLEVVKTHVGRLEITGEPAGAEVLINGTVVGRLPLAEPVRLADGTVRSSCAPRGTNGSPRRLKVEGLRTQTLRLHAEKQTAPPAAAAGTGRGRRRRTHTCCPGADLAGAGDGAPPRATATAGRGGSGPVRASLKFVSWGLAAIAAGVGTYGILHNRSLVREFDLGCGIDARARPRGARNAAPSYTDASCADLESRYESASVLGVVGLVGAGRLGDRRGRSVADRTLGAKRCGGDRVHRPLGALDLYARPRGRWRLAGVRAEVLAEPDCLGRGVSDPCRDAHRGWWQFRVSFCLRPSGLLAGIGSSRARSPRVARTETPGRALRARRVQAGRGARPSRARLGRVAAPPSRASAAGPPGCRGSAAGVDCAAAQPLMGSLLLFNRATADAAPLVLGDPRRPQHQR